eukprot:3493442-Pleurochrysis_carterae.AAC.1
MNSFQKFVLKVEAANRPKGKREAAQAAHAHSSQASGSRGPIPTDAERRAETADRNRRRKMGAEMKRMGRGMTDEEKRLNEEYWAKALEEERLGPMSLIEEYYRQGVGYIEVKGVPMIYYLTLMHGERV